MGKQKLPQHYTWKNSMILRFNQLNNEWQKFKIFTFLKLVELF